MYVFCKSCGTSSEGYVPERCGEVIEIECGSCWEDRVFGSWSRECYIAMEKEMTTTGDSFRIESIEGNLKPYFFPMGFQPAYSTVGRWISAKEAQVLAAEPTNNDDFKNHWKDWDAPVRVSNAYPDGRYLRWLSNWKEPQYIADEYLRISALHAKGESIPDPYTICQYFGQTVNLDAHGHLRGEDLRCFAAIINYCVKEGLLKYAQLAPAMKINLAILPDTGPRAMLLLYAFSDFTREQLNEKLGGVFFTNEGDLPPLISWPKNISGTVGDWLPDVPVSKKGEDHA